MRSGVRGQGTPGSGGRQSSLLCLRLLLLEGKCAGAPAPRATGGLRVQGVRARAGQPSEERPPGMPKAPTGRQLPPAGRLLLEGGLWHSGLFFPAHPLNLACALQPGCMFGYLDAGTETEQGSCFLLGPGLGRGVSGGPWVAPVLLWEG